MFNGEKIKACFNSVREMRDVPNVNEWFNVNIRFNDRVSKFIHIDKNCQVNFNCN